MYTSLTGAKTGWALFHISNRPNWQISEINLDSAQVRRKLALLVILRDNVYAAGDVFYNCTKGAKYALHSTVQTTLAKAINGNNLKAVIVEAHPYALSGAPTASSTYQSVRTDISISTAETPGEVLYYVDTTVTNGQQKKIPKRKKLSVNDNIVCCQNLLLNQTVVDNRIFSATKTKLRIQKLLKTRFQVKTEEEKN